jgi:TonB-dependent receptor-like protein
LAIDVLDSFSGGGSPCCPNESRNDTIELQDYLTYAYKRHTIKGGVQFYHENVHNLSRSNFNGTYTFSNLAEYRGAVETAGTPLGHAQQFTINRGDALLFYKSYAAGLVIQDDFRLNKSLALSLGLREEFQSQLGDRNNWSPRLGIAWSPFKNGKTTLRGGAGLFYSRLSGGIYANTLRFNDETQQSLIIRNALYPDPFASNPEIEIQARNTRKYFLDPDLEAPYTINFNLVLEQQLPKGVIGTLSSIHTRGDINSACATSMHRCGTLICGSCRMKVTFIKPSQRLDRPLQWDHFRFQPPLQSASDPLRQLFSLMDDERLRWSDVAAG